MKYLSTLLLLLICINAFSAELYSKSFGNPEHPALIFLHGGPGETHDKRKWFQGLAGRS